MNQPALLLREVTDVRVGQFVRGPTHLRRVVRRAAEWPAEFLFDGGEICPTTYFPRDASGALFCGRYGNHVDTTRDRHQYTKLATCYPPRPDPVPGCRSRDVAARRRTGPGRRGGQLADRPADRHAGAPAGQERRLRGAWAGDRSATDFTTDLAVFQDGREIARKTIRVNDPLSVAGYTFHQNGFGPAPHLLLRDSTGRTLWDAPVPMTISTGGRPYASIGVPGRDLGLKLLLDRDRMDRASHRHPLPRDRQGRRGRADRAPPRGRRPPRGDTKVSQDLDLSIGLARLRRVHAADRQAGPRPGAHLDGLRVPHRRDHHHVLSAAAPGLDAARARTAGWASSGGRTATSTSSASSAGCSTSSWPPAGRPDRTAAGRRRPGTCNLTASHNVRACGSVLNRNLVPC